MGAISDIAGTIPLAIMGMALIATPGRAAVAPPPSTAAAQAEVQRLEAASADIEARLKTARIVAAKALIADEELRSADVARARAFLAAEGVAVPQPVAAVAVPAAASAPAPPQQVAVAAPAGKVEKPAADKDRTEPKDDNSASHMFGGIEFGIGLSFTLDVGTNDRVGEAELVNGIVRVKQSDNGRARLMLESHYFFPSKVDSWLGTAGNWGFGPFVALQPGTDDIIQAVALGGMIGFRRQSTSEGKSSTSTQSFNLGVGVVVDPTTRVLGDGIYPNKPLPAGETTIRYKTEPQTGVLIMASFAF